MEIKSPKYIFTYKVYQRNSNQITIALTFLNEKEDIILEDDYLDLYLWGLPEVKTSK